MSTITPQLLKMDGRQYFLSFATPSKKMNIKWLKKNLMLLSRNSMKVTSQWSIWTKIMLILSKFSVEWLVKKKKLILKAVLKPSRLFSISMKISYKLMWTIQMQRKTKSWTWHFGKLCGYLYSAQFMEYVAISEQKFKMKPFNSFSTSLWDMENCSSINFGKWFCRVFSDQHLKRLLTHPRLNPWKRSSSNNGFGTPFLNFSQQ